MSSPTSSEISTISKQDSEGSRTSVSSKASSKKPSATKKAPTKKLNTDRTGFEYTDTFDKEDKFFVALADAKYRWVSAFSIGNNVELACTEAGRHILLLQQGEIKAENVAQAWTVTKVQTLSKTKDDQKILGPVRRNGRYKLTGNKDSSWYEGHICLSPTFAMEMVESGNLCFYAEGKVVDQQILMDHLDEIKFEAATKGAKVTVPEADTDPIAKLLEKWFKQEWAQKAYSARSAAAAREEVDIKDLYQYEDSETDDGSDEEVAEGNVDGEGEEDVDGEGEEDVDGEGEEDDKGDGESDTSFVPE